MLKPIFDEAESLLKDEDPDMREMASEAMTVAKQAIEILLADLQRLLLPRDPNDKNNVFLEVRAGTGGE